MTELGWAAIGFALGVNLGVIGMLCATRAGIDAAKVKYRADAEARLRRNRERLEPVMYESGERDR